MQQMVFKSTQEHTLFNMCVCRVEKPEESHLEMIQYSAKKTIRKWNGDEKESLWYSGLLCAELRHRSKWGKEVPIE